MQSFFLQGLIHSRNGVGCSHTHQVAFAQDVVAFAFYVFALGFALFGSEPALMFAYSCQIGGGVGADFFEAVLTWEGNDNPSFRWIDTQMDVPNVLSEDLHGEATCFL
jgi:hypothetical protein